MAKAFIYVVDTVAWVHKKTILYIVSYALFVAIPVSIFMTMLMTGQEIPEIAHSYFIPVLALHFIPITIVSVLLRALIHKATGKDPAINSSDSL